MIDDIKPQSDNVMVIAGISYVIAFAYLLYTACPLVFAVFLALPIAFMIGIPLILAVEIISGIVATVRRG